MTKDEQMGESVLGEEQERLHSNTEASQDQRCLGQSRNTTPGACLLAHCLGSHSGSWAASEDQGAGFHQSALSQIVNLVPSVLDCWSQETRPGCHHRRGDLGHLASPGGRCATEPLNYCHPERSAPLSSGSGLCLQARSG